MANQAHAADGTSNLHVHGMFVSPRPCSDEVLRSTIYPANWAGPVAPLLPCQSAPNTLTYTYDLAADHPAGLYWFTRIATARRNRRPRWVSSAPSSSRIAATPIGPRSA